MTENTDFDDDNEEKLVNFSIRIEAELIKRLEKHLHLLKYFEHNKKSKQQWIREALVAKVKHDQKNLPDALSKEKQLSVRIDPRLNDKIEKNVDFIKAFKSGFSKKQWVIEAVEEKLKQEEEQAKKLFAEVSEKMIT